MSSWPRQTSFEPCMSAYSFVRTHRQNFALLRESLGVSRINHFLQVHGHTIPQEREAAKVFDEGWPIERLFPVLTEDSSEQATLSASQSGIRYIRVRDVARPAHIGSHCSQAANSGHDSGWKHGWTPVGATFADATERSD